MAGPGNRPGEGVKVGAAPGNLRVVRRIRRELRLQRTLGVPALFSSGYGNVGSSIYYALGVTAVFALGATPIALTLAGVFFILTVFTYTEATVAVPEAGGASNFARQGFNELVSFITGWGTLLAYTVTIAISSFSAVSYLAVFFPIFEHQGPVVIGAIVVIALLMGLNLIGVEEAATLSVVFAVLDLATEIVLVIVGGIFLVILAGVAHPLFLHQIHWGTAPSLGNFVHGAAIAMVAYTGIETISNLSEEAKNPGRSVPRATYAVIIAVLFVAAFLPTIGLSVFPVHLDQHGMYITDLATKYKADPVAGIVGKFMGPLGFWAVNWVGILAFTILLIATNAGLIGISRLSYSLAGAEMLPRRFASLHPKYKTPYISIIVFGLLAAMLVLPGIIVGSKEIDLMSAVYSLAATVAFCSAHLSVMRLRFVEPDLYRPYRMPFNIKFGRDSIPVLSLVGALAIGTVFTQLFFQNISNSTWIFLAWMSLGVLSWVLYRKYRKEPLWEPLEVPAPQDREVEHVPAEPMPLNARLRLGRRERIAAHAAAAPHLQHHRRRSWRVGWELYWRRHGNVRGGLIVLVFAAVSGLAVGLDLSSYDPFGTGLGWSPGIVLVALMAAYLLNRSHAER